MIPLCSKDMAVFYLTQALSMCILQSQLGNCDIDFFNFCHHKVQNFEILKINQNFAVIFWKYQKQKRTRVTPWKFHEMSLVLWNLINNCKIMQFLIKFCESLKDLRKILLKWLGKTVTYCLNFVNFHSCTENGRELANFCL